ncbi:hypothetical protein [Myxococcus phage Mx1]|nr:hypothetical protein [Myxococcus phage Mx1]
MNAGEDYISGKDALAVRFRIGWYRVYVFTDFVTVKYWKVV